MIEYVLVLKRKVLHLSSFGIDPVASWFEGRIRLAFDVLLSTEGEVFSPLCLCGMNPSLRWFHWVINFSELCVLNVLKNEGKGISLEHAFVLVEFMS